MGTILGVKMIVFPIKDTIARDLLPFVLQNAEMELRS
jgi:hypothetical protein